MLYNTTNLTGSTDFVGILSWLQLDTGLFIAQIIMLIIFVVAFANFSTRWNVLQSFIGAAFISTMVGAAFHMVEILHKQWVTLGVITLGLAIFAIYVSRHRR